MWRSSIGSGTRSSRARPAKLDDGAATGGVLAHHGEPTNAADYVRATTSVRLLPARSTPDADVLQSLVFPSVGKLDARARPRPRERRATASARCRARSTWPRGSARPTRARSFMTAAMTATNASTRRSTRSTRDRPARAAAARLGVRVVARRHCHVPRAVGRRCVAAERREPRVAHAQDRSGARGLDDASPRRAPVRALPARHGAVDHRAARAGAPRAAGVRRGAPRGDREARVPGSSDVAWPPRARRDAGRVVGDSDPRRQRAAPGRRLRRSRGGEADDEPRPKTSAPPWSRSPRASPRWRMRWSPATPPTRRWRSSCTPTLVSSRALVEACGDLDDLYTVKREPGTGRLVLAVGAASSHSELTVPANERPTDVTWRARLHGSPPPGARRASPRARRRARRRAMPTSADAAPRRRGAHALGSFGARTSVTDRRAPSRRPRRARRPASSRATPARSRKGPRTLRAPRRIRGRGSPARPSPRRPRWRRALRPWLSRRRRTVVHDVSFELATAINPWQGVAYDLHRATRRPRRAPLRRGEVADARLRPRVLAAVRRRAGRPGSRGSLLVCGGASLGCPSPEQREDARPRARGKGASWTDPIERTSVSPASRVA